MTACRRSGRCWTELGTVINFGQNSREYIVRFQSNGKHYIRNRHFLKPNLAIRFNNPRHAPTTPDIPQQQPQATSTPPPTPPPPASLPLPPPTSTPPTELRRSSRAIIKPARFRQELNTAHRSVTQHRSAHTRHF